MKDLTKELISFKDVPTPRNVKWHFERLFGGKLFLNRMDSEEYGKNSFKLIADHVYNKNDNLSEQEKLFKKYRDEFVRKKNDMIKLIEEYKVYNIGFGTILGAFGIGLIWFMASLIKKLKK